MTIIVLTVYLHILQTMKENLSEANEIEITESEI